MTNLWSANTPADFWLCQPDPPAECWELAFRNAAPILGLCPEPANVDELLALVLGEGQFGPRHWQLSRARRAYYAVKPLLPRRLIAILRRAQSLYARGSFPLGWPIEDRYVRFLWDVMRQLLVVTGQSAITHAPFWPDGKPFALVLTHDVETAEGQAFVRTVADLDARFGFRSSFNFVPERYTLDRRLVAELQARGFEIGVHGLKHDGKLFTGRSPSMESIGRVNAWLHELNAVGFRSPYTMRNPEWMQALEIEYDSSFFDTDPYEPMPGGVMSIWPFRLGRFIELPYTLLQDHTLTTVLGQSTPRLWFEKLAFIRAYRGMALLNTHPDYLAEPSVWRIYEAFLQAMVEQGGYWHALPRDVARWWRSRSACPEEVFRLDLVPAAEGEDLSRD